MSAAAKKQLAPPPFTLSDDEFARFGDFIYQKTGIRFQDNRRDFVSVRIAKRMAEMGLHSFRTYFTKMRFQSSNEEFQELVNLLTVNETYFLREHDQLEALAGPILDEVAQTANGRVLNIWSIPCATGEEPCSVAMMLLEHWPKIETVDVKIFGSDIDSEVLKKAKRGTYSPRSVQNIPDKMRDKYFNKLGNHRYKLSPDIVDCVDYRLANIMDPALSRSMPRMDVILCRNVLIYFDDVSRREAVQTLYDSMHPGGFILLGHSESMSRMSSLFRVRRFGKAIVYQKPHE